MRRLLWCLLAVLTLLPPATVYANLDISFKANEHGVPDVEIRLYYVGDLENGHVIWQEPFIGLDATDARAIESRIIGQRCEPVRSVRTTPTGLASVTDVDAGVYCILADTYRRDGIVYNAVSTLVYVPKTCHVELKVESTAVPEGDIAVTATKVWECRNNEHPDSVSVTLLRNDVPYDTVELSITNNWMYTWARLDAEASWSVIETHVPDGFVASVSKSNTNFTIKNTALDYIRVTPQTGVADTTKTDFTRLLCICVILLIFGRFKWERKSK